MRTVQISLDEDLVRAVDRVVRDLHTTRSAFVREALQQAIARAEIQRLEEEHRQGYLGRPEGADEFIRVRG
jgi:metal-responsive CopG/Arc/MetJ family transcriptional regulator